MKPSAFRRTLRMIPKEPWPVQTDTEKISQDDLKKKNAREVEVKSRESLGVVVVVTTAGSSMAKDVVF